MHPGLLVTEADLQRIRDKLAANAQPWVGGWNMMLKTNNTNLAATPRPLALVTRGVDGENYWQMVGDMVRALHLALRWKITNDENYATKAVEFLNAWSSTLTELGGNSNVFLASGLYGNQWANAAELMRTYSGWAKEDVARFQTMLLNVFYPKCHDFLVNHNGTETRKVTHYWANWDLANICSIYAIGVFCDRPDLIAEASNYYKSGRGNGASANNVYYVHPGYLGQWQESH
ncbi:alginate lyase family protein, partial [Variovorax beijingensis]|uniref:alginate lyase family protein n=1 Tax=Variovorax beijingensis TaxID=2496117 RepID=UPI001F0BBC01